MNFTGSDRDPDGRSCGTCTPGNFLPLSGECPRASVREEVRTVVTAAQSYIESDVTTQWSHHFPTDSTSFEEGATCRSPSLKSPLSMCGPPDKSVDQRWTSPSRVLTVQSGIVFSVTRVFHFRSTCPPKPPRNLFIKLPKWSPFTLTLPLKEPHHTLVTHSLFSFRTIPANPHPTLLKCLLVLRL